MVISEPLRQRLDQFMTEGKKLREECEARGDLPKNSLDKLKTTLDHFNQQVVAANQLAGRKVETNTGQKSVDEALKAVLFLQQMMPQTDAKAINALLVKLFSVLSAEMQKFNENEKTDKKKKSDLEELEKKLTRTKEKQSSKVEKTFESNKLGG